MYYYTTRYISTASITKVKRKFHITVPKKVREAMSIHGADQLTVITDRYDDQKSGNP